MTYATTTPIRIEDHLALARWVASKLVRWRTGRPARAIDDTEEFADACMGLMKAAERFDPNRGVKFATYAHWWVQQFIRRGLEVRHGFGGKHARNSGKQAAREIPFSEMKLPDDEAGPVESLFAAPPEPEPEDATSFERISRLLSVLDRRGRRIVYKRILGYTLAQVAAEENPPIGKERVRQLQERAIKTIRRKHGKGTNLIPVGLRSGRSGGPYSGQ